MIVKRGSMTGACPFTPPCRRGEGAQYQITNHCREAPRLPAYGARGASYRRQFKIYFFSRKGLRRSIGTGKIVVEFFSVATSVRVCRNLS